MVRVRTAFFGGWAFCCVAAVAAGTTKTPLAKASPTLPLISLLDVMRASIEVPADGIWATEGADKVSEEEWQLVDQDAVQLIGASTVVAKGGAGKNDGKWAAHADWQDWVRDMSTTAVALRAAAKAQDTAKLAALGDRLQGICAACHAKYRPAAPSDGVARYPFYPKRELVR